MSSPRPRMALNKGEASKRFATVYQVVMTPVIFVSFLVSLVFVDFKYSLMRSHNHSEATSRMPRWLHTLLYREAPYQYVRVDRSKPDTPTAGNDGARWHYHTKQRKLMKMEAEDAFRMRGSVLVVLGLLAVAVSCVAWHMTWWLWAVVTARHGRGAG